MHNHLPRLALAALLASCSLPALAASTSPAPGTVFRDCTDVCPELVVLPAGSFMMGTPDDEQGRQDDEGPLHQVTFAKAFAMSRFQVTAQEWDNYLKQSGAVIQDGDVRPGRKCTASKPTYKQGPRQPAVCMTYFDVQDYVEWLSKKTGKTYRMVTESEREYAARAGSSGPFPFPFDPDGEYQISRHANVYGPKDGYSYTSPVGSFPPNAFGMYDMHGNVYEWVADCLHDNYIGAPTDGSAWGRSTRSADSCTVVQIRGNDWGEAPIFSRSGNRNAMTPRRPGDWLGFRVVREL
ncbi:formylglycine-generating enzyme family protein [Pseudomonas fakonensis]|uniref:Formylglycine-generating enzyme family protein n=1 Tax=Pseudomonas fakonensis TaxID=2842355 RepID=A0ABX8MZI5_9PSED|nr:formylglycine-generating enzyme family protein [Pseudomonas fakonensis]QXH49535.1 formylglycine-generating enzyme family protein [Pseudomonas fakonensis]